MIIFFKDRALKQNCNDTVYLKYRRKAQKFYYNRTLEYLKSEKLRIEVRYEDRKQNDAYSSLSCIVSIIALCISILNFCISENERGEIHGKTEKDYERDSSKTRRGIFDGVK